MSSPSAVAVATEPWRCIPSSVGLRAADTNNVSSAIDWMRSTGAAATYSAPPRIRRIGSARAMHEGHQHAARRHQLGHLLQDVAQPVAVVARGDAHDGKTITESMTGSAATSSKMRVDVANSPICSSSPETSDMTMTSTRKIGGGEHGGERDGKSDDGEPSQLLPGPARADEVTAFEQ